ncbi:MAG TPA: IS1634 family transposase [Streptosporangiaceae bacterium]|nr:IS1634 family transposase [Streptosporangiaceae bacterium]
MVGKKRGGSTYYYLVESARVGGKPRIVSQEYLGTAEELAAAMRGGGLGLPDRVQHKDFGVAAAAWGMLEDLGVAGLIDAAAGPRRADAGASAGMYLALAALNRLAAPCSKLRFAEWWATTAAPRFTKIPATVLDHRRFWDAMHAATLEQLEAAGQAITLRAVQASGLDCSSVALDMTNFATFIDTQNKRAPVAQRGKARQKRAGLRLAGLGLVVTRDGGIPLTWHTYPGDKPDVTQFPDMITQLLARYQAVCGRSGVAAEAAGMTVVFDAGQNSEANFAHLAAAGLSWIGSVPASDCPDLLALPASARSIVDADRFGQLTACDTRRQAYGAGRRAILTHSPELHQAQAAGFGGTTLAKAGKKLDELAATLARGRTRRPRDKVEAEITAITARPWVRRVITWQLTGDQPRDFRLTWQVDAAARTALEEEIFGKHVLITGHDDWPAAEVIAGYRSQSEAESAFRQMKDTHVVSFSPMFHWTEHNIRVHVFTCVLALQLAHLMRLKARRAGLDLSVRELLRELGGIGETVLLYKGDRGRPRAHRMLTETTPVQDKLAQIFSLDRYAPRR